MDEKKFGMKLPDFFKKPKQAQLQFFLLMMIQESPIHGYEIIKKIEKRTFGKWRPSHSSIYNLLNTLTEKGIIEVDKSGERDKKIYKITKKGEKLTEIFRQEVGKLFHSLIKTLLSDEEFEVPPPAIRMALREEGMSLLESYSKEEQKKILSRFKQSLEDDLEKVIIKLKKLEKA